MRILVSGTGHGGTCLLVEAVRGLDLVRFTSGVEDREFFKYVVLPENYGTKLVTDHPFFSLSGLTRFMNRHLDLHIVFSLRHPLDVFMSKIVRGQKASDGGDRKGEWISDDGTPDMAIDRIVKFHLIYKEMVRLHPDRVISVNLENLILTPKQVVGRIAEFFKVKPTEQALTFYKYNRNKYHRHRYKGCLDTSTVNLYRNWETAYDGFFKDKHDDILAAATQLQESMKDLGYEA